MSISSSTKPLWSLITPITGHSSRFATSHRAALLRQISRQDANRNAHSRHVAQWKRRARISAALSTLGGVSGSGDGGGKCEPGEWSAQCTDFIHATGGGVKLFRLVDGFNSHMSIQQFRHARQWHANCDVVIPPH